jgi:Zn-dependent protease with chaperone function
LGIYRIFYKNRFLETIVKDKRLLLPLILIPSMTWNMFNRYKEKEADLESVMRWNTAQGLLEYLQYMYDKNVTIEEIVQNWENPSWKDYMREFIYLCFGDHPSFHERIAYLYPIA